jgi:hypothetical protein
MNWPVPVSVACSLFAFAVNAAAGCGTGRKTAIGTDRPWSMVFSAPPAKFNSAVGSLRVVRNLAARAHYETAHIRRCPYASEQDLRQIGEAVSDAYPCGTCNQAARALRRKFEGQADHPIQCASPPGGL